MGNKVIVLVIEIVILLAHARAQNYSNQWVISGNLSRIDIANIARRYGFTFFTKLLHEQYLFIENDSSRSSRIKNRYLAKQIIREDNVKATSQQYWQQRVLRNGAFKVNDPQWTNMWYFNKPTVDIEIEASWKQGYDGTGVTIAIVDDGVDFTHPDLKENYVDGIDAYDNDIDPKPSPGDTHGTECAGVAVAVKNKVCVIGAAFKAKLKAVRLIGPLGSTDAGEQLAFTLSGVDIYSNSWGTNDRDTFDGPKSLAKLGLEDGIKNGRRGLGSIYVVAAGNGGFDDNCNCDGYANSIYTIAIMAVTKKLEPPGYSEYCAAALASAYSGPGGSTGDDVCTSSPGNSCPCNFTGTSAAAPMAAGILALVLQANPKLTWRDVQYLVVQTSITSGLTYGNFIVNGVGRRVSDTYGYGLLNATALIAEAKIWNTVDPHHICTTGIITSNSQVAAHAANRTVESVMETDGCNNTSVCVNSVEHVEVTASFYASLRGAVRLTLQSPSGTKSRLLTRRINDMTKNQQQDWTYMSVQFWEENPIGSWKLTMDLTRDPTETATFKTWSLKFYGTGESCSIPLDQTTIGTTDQIQEQCEETSASEDCSGGCGTLCIALVSASSGIFIIIMVSVCILYKKGLFKRMCKFGTSIQDNALQNNKITNNNNNEERESN